ncbi:MAG: glycosyltransferase 87 family protein [Marinirhabdus sp.]
MKYIKPNISTLLVALASVIFYLSFAYDLDRSNFIKLLALYAGLFFTAWRIIVHSKFNFWVLAAMGVLFRLLFIGAVPNLSQDFYRFLWDGRLLIQGADPYIVAPQQFITDPALALGATSGKTVPQAARLIAGMGELNAGHYSNYPPVNQLLFAIAALFAKHSVIGSVIVLRVLIVIADVGILYFGKKMLQKLRLPPKNIFLYFLNPFVIIELTGNLHFEGVMLFFVVWALYLFFKRKWFWAALLLGVSVSVKLIPLLFLPLFFGWSVKPKTGFFGFGTIRFTLFCVVTLATVLLFFAPFLSSGFVENFSSTIALWFGNFEFNASVYYIIRWVGYRTVGWNIIGTVGKVLPVIVVVFVLGLAFFRKNDTPQKLITAMLFAVSFYLLLATTVHPWYIVTPLVLSVFTKYRFPLVWGFVVVVSYSAYGAGGVKENLWLVASEYVLVTAFALWELFVKKPDRRQLHNPLH